MGAVYHDDVFECKLSYLINGIVNSGKRLMAITCGIQGFELDPVEFVARKALEDCEILDKWEAAQAAATSTSRQLDLMHA